ncbi:MAG: accessory gene regulator B family protein [Oscillospiraceae bacterium]|jgi:accessory gene regulator B|nr:accessory gene regulator B family protein [Oscillospiraceae bacterium]
MITKLSKNISELFINKEVIHAEDREVYEYSFELLISSIISLIIITVGAIITGTILYTVFYLLGFIPLRLVAGGYHAKNHLRCIFILIITYITFVLISHFIPNNYMVIVILSCITASVVLVFIIAPSEDANKPLTITEIMKFKKKSRYIIIVMVAIIGLLIIIISNNKIAFSMTMGVLTVSVSLLANRIKQMLLRKKYIV